jgi:tetratricopeptide (TPR) repeat protein
MRRELLGADHPEVGHTLFNLASLQFERGESKEALANVREVLAIFRKAYPPDHPSIAFALNVMGFWQTMAGDFGEADRFLAEGLSMRRRLFGDGQPDVASSLMMLAILRDAEGQFPEALQLAQTAKGIYTKALSADHWRTAIAESAEGAALSGLGRYPEADAALTHSYEILRQDTGAPFVYRTLTRRYVDELHQRERHPIPSAAATAIAAASGAKPPLAGDLPQTAGGR